MPQSRGATRRSNSKRQLFRDEDVPPSANGNKSPKRHSSQLSPGRSSSSSSSTLSLSDQAEKGTFATEPKERQLPSNGHQWLACEWLYSGIDKVYFDKNDFVCCLQEWGFGNINVVPRGAWNRLRQEVGRPRRFSQAFLRDERDSLQRHREDIVLLRRVSSLTQTVPQPLVPQTQVIAFHPNLRRLCLGRICEHRQLQHRIQFDNGDSFWVDETTLMRPVERLQSGDHNLHSHSHPSSVASPSASASISPKTPSQKILIKPAQELQSPSEPASSLLKPSTLSYSQKALATLVVAFKKHLQQKAEVLRELAMLIGQQDNRDSIAATQHCALLLVNLQRLNKRLEDVQTNLWQWRHRTFDLLEQQQ